MLCEKLVPLRVVVSPASPGWLKCVQVGVHLIRDALYGYCEAMERGLSHV